MPFITSFLIDDAQVQFTFPEIELYLHQIALMFDCRLASYKIVCPLYYREKNVLTITMEEEFMSMLRKDNLIFGRTFWLTRLNLSKIRTCDATIIVFCECARIGVIKNKRSIMFFF